MRKIYQILTLFAFLAGFLPLLVGCRSVTSILLTPNNKDMQVGEIAQLRVLDAENKNTFNGGVLWISRTPVIAEVDQYGFVQAHLPGIAEIEVIYVNNSALSATATIAILGEQAEVNSPFPSLRVTTPDIRNFSISRENWQNADFAIESVVDEYQFQGSGRIRGRGNSTWRVGLRDGKPPFRIRLSEPASLLGANHAATDWSFLANLSDLSLLRNQFAKDFANRMETFTFTPRIKNVHVYINGVYWGIYTLAEQIESLDSDDRVPVIFDEDPTKSEYLIEMCRRLGRTAGNVEYVDFISINDRNTIEDSLSFEVRHPDMSAGNGLRFRDHTIYAKEFLVNVNDAIISRNWDRIQAAIDVDSFVDWYIVNELMKNLDSHWSSVFMQIRHQGDERRLYMGPVWDFDQSAGNIDRRFHNNENFDCDPEGFWTTRHRWFNALMRVNGFRQRVQTRWAQAQGVLDETIGYVTNLARWNRDCFIRNFESGHRQDSILGNPRPRPGATNPPTFAIDYIDTWMEQVDFFLNFIQNRRIWLSNNF